MIGILIIKFGTDTERDGEIKCLIKLTGKTAKLKCSEFSTWENPEIKTRRKKCLTVSQL